MLPNQCHATIAAVQSIGVLLDTKAKYCAHLVQQLTYHLKVPALAASGMIAQTRVLCKSYHRGSTDQVLLLNEYNMRDAALDKNTLLVVLHILCA
jgi:hypothetical protein